ncbi:hypothetical protein IW01_20800 [Pectobacterium brasiliense]|nr:hypothetical protein IW01_20800 [Pectobacterium brasiliense]
MDFLHTLSVIYRISIRRKKTKNSRGLNRNNSGMTGVRGKFKKVLAINRHESIDITLMKPPTVKMTEIIAMIKHKQVPASKYRKLPQHA